MSNLSHRDARYNAKYRIEVSGSDSDSNPDTGNFHISYGFQVSGGTTSHTTEDLRSENGVLVSRQFSDLRDTSNGYSFQLTITGPHGLNLRWSRSGGSSMHQLYEVGVTMTDGVPHTTEHRQGTRGTNSTTDLSASSAGNGTIGTSDYYDLFWIDGVVQNPTGFTRVGSTPSGTTRTQGYSGSLQDWISSDPPGFGSFMDDISSMLNTYASNGEDQYFGAGSFFRHGTGDTSDSPYEHGGIVDQETWYFDDRVEEYTSYADGYWTEIVYSDSSKSTIVSKNYGYNDKSASANVGTNKVTAASGGTTPTLPPQTGADDVVENNTSQPGENPEAGKADQALGNAVGVLPNDDQRQTPGSVATSSQTAQDVAKAKADETQNNLSGDVRGAIQAPDAEKTQVWSANPPAIPSELERLKKDVQYAHLSSLAYNVSKTDDLPLGMQDKGWTIPTDSEGKPAVKDDRKTGFRAVVFYNTETKERVIAYAGTDIKQGGDKKNNIRQGLVGNAEQYKQAIRFASAAADEFGPISRFVGHSLGGGLATAAALVFGKEGTTFNAAGLNPNTVARYGVTLERANVLVTAYRLKGEPLTALQDATWIGSGPVVGFFAWLMPDSNGSAYLMESSTLAPLRHGMVQFIFDIEERIRILSLPEY